MIIFESVTKQFGEDPPALDGISFEIEEGELVVITGHSGSGKTTLMRLLTKEYLPNEGEIYFNGNPLSQIRGGNVPQHRRQLGIVFQDYKLLPELNVWENIALALNILGKKQDETEARVTDLLRLVDLVDKAFLFPSQLSGGEAQRVSIARALATAPRVIFADEPTGNLDPETSISIARLLEKINDLGTTVIITTHDISVMDILTKERHMKLDKGKLINDTGTHQHHKKSTPAKPDSDQSASENEPAKIEQEPPTVVSTETLDAENAGTPKSKRGFGLPKVSLFGRRAKPNKPKATETETTKADKETDPSTTANAKTHTTAKSGDKADKTTEPKPSKKTVKEPEKDAESVSVKVESL